jgi:hypothetical protein
VTSNGWLFQASKAGLRIFRPGVKVEEESQGWVGWMWSGWSGDDGAKSKEVKTGGETANIPNHHAPFCTYILIN